jgi:single-stranded DNA-binding protein
MRNLERRRHQEDLLHHMVAYLISLDKLFDDQAKLLREQISQAEQVEVTVRMHQVRVAQAEARTTTAISSEVVAHESLRRIQDQRMQEWTNSGTPISSIGEAQVLLGTPLVGWGGTIEAPPAPPVVTEPPAATAEVAAQPQGNGNPEGEDDDELLIPLEVHSTPEEGSPRE